MRWIVLVAVAVLGCASPQGSPMDGGSRDLSANCDPTTLFATCTAQCHEPVCIVASVECVGGQYVCDCTQTGPCPNHD